MKSKPLVLVLTDFSDVARNAYAPARRLAERLDGRIELLHVLPPIDPLPTARLGSTSGEFQNPGVGLEAAGRALEEECEKLGGPSRTETHVVLAHQVGKGVADYARESGAEMVALASHGRSGLRRALMGSVAEQVIRASHTPVMVVPSSSEEEGQKNGEKAR